MLNHLSESEKDCVEDNETSCREWQTVPLPIGFRVIFCSFVRLEGFCESVVFLVFPCSLRKLKTSLLKTKGQKPEVHLRLAFPAGGVCFPCTLHSHSEASSSSLRGPSSPEWASIIRESSEEWFSRVLHSIVKWRQCHSGDSVSWSSLQSGSGREPAAIPVLKKKKKTERSQHSIPSRLIHTTALTLSLQRAVLFPVWLKISKFRFIMTGADKFAGEMQAVSLSC